MKILVTVKQVPDTSGKVAVNPDGTLDRASMQTIINPDDLNAVEAALSLKDELGCKVIAFTMGPPPAEGMLRELMAMGVDEGVLMTAREFGGSDTYATSQIIAAAIDTYGVEADDIILAGRQAIDGDTAQVGPQIAEKLHLPQVILRRRDQEGGQHRHREAHAGGRLHDRQGQDSLHDHLHQGAERAPLHVRHRYRGVLRQASGHHDL